MSGVNARYDMAKHVKILIVSFIRHSRLPALKHMQVRMTSILTALVQSPANLPRVMLERVLGTRSQKVCCQLLPGSIESHIGSNRVIAA